MNNDIIQQKLSRAQEYFKLFCHLPEALNTDSLDQLTSNFLQWFVNYLTETVKDKKLSEVVDTIESEILYDFMRDQFDSRFTQEQVIEMLTIGINPKTVNLEMQTRLYSQLPNIQFIKEYIKNNHYKSDSLKEPNLKLFSAEGYHSVILMDYLLLGRSSPDDKGLVATISFMSPYIYKLSDCNKNEIQLSEQIGNVSFKNVIIGKHIGNEILELACVGAHIGIGGYFGARWSSINNLLKIRNRFHSIDEFSSTELVIHAGRDIFNGLLELKEYKIFHRDLMLGNIIWNPKHEIEYLNNKIGCYKIVDFGLATNISNAEQQDNRRYGGANDIISLGQILYRLYVGRNLFKADIEKSSWRLANEIKIFRDECYQTPELLELRLKEVSTNIQGEDNFGLREIITTCLTANIPNQINSSFADDEIYDKLRELFNKYTNQFTVNGYQLIR